MKPYCHQGETTEGAVFLDVEQDLRTLKGILAACRLLGTGLDPIDPLALSVLASHGNDTLERLTAELRKTATV